MYFQLFHHTSTLWINWTTYGHYYNAHTRLVLMRSSGWLGDRTGTQPLRLTLKCSLTHSGAWQSQQRPDNSRVQQETNIVLQPLLANVRYMLSPIRLSVVCNTRAPYSGGSNFRQYFYGISYLGYPLTSSENFTEIVPGEPLRRGELNTRGVAKYSDFGLIDGYISETVQDRR